MSYKNGNKNKPINGCIHGCIMNLNEKLGNKRAVIYVKIFILLYFNLVACLYDLNIIIL